MHRFSRRNIIISSIAASIPIYGVSACSRSGNEEVSPSKEADVAIANEDAAIISNIAEIEKSHGGRLGVCILNTQSGKTISYRGEERFTLCSTFKLALAAIILHEIDGGRLNPAQEIPIAPNGMPVYSPLVQKGLAAGKLSIIKCAEAIQVNSDNVASNALLKLIGGPSAMTKFLRDLGDSVTNIDRYEPEMNHVRAGEVHDTTSPDAMAQTVQKLLLGNFLSAASSSLLIDWMIKTKTGEKRIRAGLPQDWRAGDKTGTGIFETINNQYNDIAICWPPNMPPHIICVYYEGQGYFDDIRDIDQAALRNVGRIASQWIIS